MKNHRQKITPEMAQRHLKEFGTDVTLEEAKLVVDFMYKLAKMVIKTYVKPQLPNTKF